MKKTAPLLGASTRPGGGPLCPEFAEIVSRAIRLQTATTSLLHASKRRGHRTPAFTGRIRKRQKKSLLLLGSLLLGSWLLSSLLLSGHIGLPPSFYFGPDEWFW